VNVEQFDAFIKRHKWAARSIYEVLGIKGVLYEMLLSGKIGIEEFQDEIRKKLMFLEQLEEVEFSPHLLTTGPTYSKKQEAKKDTTERLVGCAFFHYPHEEICSHRIDFHRITDETVTRTKGEDVLSETFYGKPRSFGDYLSNEYTYEGVTSKERTASRKYDVLVLYENVTLEDDETYLNFNKAILVSKFPKGFKPADL
jgi:hypothetical protein